MKKRPLILSQEDDLYEAVTVLRRGGVIAYPTETFYGLAADPFNAKAVERVFALKRRPADKPLSLIVKDMAMLKRVVGDVPPVAVGLIRRYWPGPLTIVFEAAKDLPPVITAGTCKIAVRISSSPVAMRLVTELGSPVTATSANPSGSLPAATGRQVIDYFNGTIDIVIDAGELPGRLGSTVVDVTGNLVTLVREGEIPYSELSEGSL